MNNTGRVYVRGQIENSQSHEQRLTDNYFKSHKGLRLHFKCQFSRKLQLLIRDAVGITIFRILS